MSRTFMALIAIAAMLSASGCPMGGSGPKLSVYPTAFDFQSQGTTNSFELFNTGAGELTWEVGALPSWVHVDPSGTGVTTTELTEFTITVDRSTLSNGSHSGEFTITSNGGSQLVTVSLIVVPIPDLDVDLTEIDFGNDTTASLEICNPGTGELDWAIEGPAWIDFDAETGTVAPGECVTVDLTADRSGQSAGAVNGTLVITSNGGDADVPVTMNVPPLVVTPPLVNFGRTLSTATITIANSGNQAYDYTIPATLPTWIGSVSPSSGNVPAGGQVIVTLQADRTALQPGVFTGLLAVQSAGGNGQVRLRIEGPQPELAVSPTSLQFFDADFNDEGIATGIVNVSNTGDGTLSWSVLGSLPAWIQVEPKSGNVATGFSPITVSVDRSLIVPSRDEDATASFTVRSLVDGVVQSAQVSVSARVLPATLTATPLNLDFGTRQSQKLLAIWNSGVGTVNWNIDTSGFPGWLSVSAASGSATGAETDSVNVMIDRTGIDPQDGGYSHSFPITGTDGDGNALETLTVRATMNVAEVPTITVDTGVDLNGVPNVDETGIPYLPFGTRTSTLTFTVGNIGTGTLNWSIDTTVLPSWVVSVTPSQETLEPGQEVTVTVIVTREELPFGSVNHTVILASNDPNNDAQPVRLEVQIPKKVSIGARPGQLSFGLFDLTSFIEVANLGDPGSVLNFVIESNKPWLFFYPETGSSIGTGLEIKDWRPFNISIDRSALDETGSVGELTIRAFESDEEGNRVFLEDVAPAVIRVSVEAAELTFETAEARTRIPSLVRYILTMRDIRYRAIPLAPEVIEDYANDFSIFQDSVLVEATETEQFLTSGTGSSGANLKTNVAIVLDYSGSMVDAASHIDDPLFAGIEKPEDVLQEAYERTVSRLLEELPAHYRIALMEFHDRGQETRIVRGLDTNSDGMITPDERPLIEDEEELNLYYHLPTDYTTDRPTLLARLRSIESLIEDHGSSDVLVAAQEAAHRIVFRDTNYDRHPFDDADVRVIIFVSDGRLTTPPGEIDDAIDALAEQKVRFLPVGWGQNVNHEPMARIAAGTGGHYYATRGEPNDEILDTFGRAVRVPVFSELLDHMSTDDVAVDPCDQSIAKDLQAQVVLSFVSLNEERGVDTRVEATFDNPNDGTECLADQGPISGFFEQEINYDEIVGDVRMGQISMRTDGNATGAADVRIRLEYAPRNINKFAFTIEAPQPFSVSVIPFDDGGAIEHWIPAATNPVGEVLSGTYRFDTPAETFLRYGDFGDLLNVHFDGAVAEFRMTLVVDNSIYQTDVEPKRFIYPDSIPVRLGDFLASAFPSPHIRLLGGSEPITILDFGDSLESTILEVRNSGGNLPYPADVFEDCIYHWTLASGTDIEVSDDEGRLNTTIDATGGYDGLDQITVTPERNLLAPGPYEQFLIFSYDPVCIDLRNLVLPPRAITVEWFVTEALLGVESPNFADPNVPELAFGDSGTGFTTLTFDVVNTGQSSVNWEINLDTLPPWITSIAPALGIAPSTIEGANTVTVTVDRALLNPGEGLYSIVVEGKNTFTDEPVGDVSVSVTIEP